MELLCWLMQLWTIREKKRKIIKMKYEITASMELSVKGSKIVSAFFHNASRVIQTRQPISHLIAFGMFYMAREVITVRGGLRGM